MQENKPFLEIAKIFGKKICDDSIWYDDRCNWIGTCLSQEYSENNTTFLNAVEALGPYFYDGTSGIAYFLAHLYRQTKKERFKKTARGAIANALSKLESDVVHPVGFYSGKLGIIFSAVHVGNLIHDDLIVKQAYHQLQELYENPDDQNMLDVISGNAGSIGPLLSLYHMFDDKKILDLALSMGDELLSSASKTSRGWSWGYDSNGVEATHDLTGFSHGAAGMGNGLLELFNETGEKRFLEGGQRAFEYENSWFDKENCNWPDFRIDETADVEETSSEPLNYFVGWCHGAPGIGLSRLRAYGITEDESYLHDFDSAASLTKRMVEQSMSYDYDFSLCHGLFGLSELFLIANQLLPNDSYKLVVDSIANHGIQKYKKTFSWRCGIDGGQPPGMMLGLSGIGYSYLRLYDPNKTPSVLLVTP